MSTAPVNGHHLYFEDSGGDHPVVLFNHGFLMDHEMFAPQVEALSDAYRCITWDQRGHGATPTVGPFTYWDSADDALALLSHLGVEQATFAGMSQGGFVSLRAALRAPERVSSLVLIDTQAGLESPESVPAYDAMLEEWTAHGPAGVQELVAAIILGEGADAAPWFAKWAAMPTNALVHPYRCLMDRDDLSERLGEIAVPAVVLHGDQDSAIPMERAEALCSGLAGCQGVVVIRGAGHASNLTHPEQVNPVLRQFLDELH